MVTVWAQEAGKDLSDISPLDVGYTRHITMKAAQLKTKILILKVLDWLLLLVVLGVGVPALFISEQKFYIGIGLLIGLSVINIVGNWSSNKIASLKVDLKYAE